MRKLLNLAVNLHDPRDDDQVEPRQRVNKQINAKLTITQGRGHLNFLSNFWNFINQSLLIKNFKKFTKIHKKISPTPFASNHSALTPRESFSWIMFVWWCARYAPDNHRFDQSIRKILFSYYFLLLLICSLPRASMYVLDGLWNLAFDWKLFSLASISNRKYINSVIICFNQRLCTNWVRCSVGFSLLVLTSKASKGKIIKI